MEEVKYAILDFYDNDFLSNNQNKKRYCLDFINQLQNKIGHEKYEKYVSRLYDSYLNNEKENIDNINLQEYQIIRFDNDEILKNNKSPQYKFLNKFLYYIYNRYRFDNDRYSVIKEINFVLLANRVLEEFEKLIINESIYPRSNNLNDVINFYKTIHENEINNWKYKGQYFYSFESSDYYDNSKIFDKTSIYQERLNMFQKIQREDYNIRQKKIALTDSLESKNTYLPLMSNQKILQKVIRLLKLDGKTEVALNDEKEKLYQELTDLTDEELKNYILKSIDDLNSKDLKYFANSWNISEIPRKNADIKEKLKEHVHAQVPQGILPGQIVEHIAKFSFDKKPLTKKYGGSKKKFLKKKTLKKNTINKITLQKKTLNKKHS